MNYEVITGTYSSGNDMIDALISAWTFDSTDQTSATHSADWGTTRLTCYDQTYISLYADATFVPNGSISLGNSGGTYTIYKTSSVLLCVVGDGIIALTIGTSAVNGTDTAKLIGMAHGNYEFVCGNDNVWTGTYTSRISITDTSVVQIFPYVHAFGAFESDDLFLLQMAQATTINTRYYINDVLYYIYHGFAIKLS